MKRFLVPLVLWYLRFLARTALKRHKPVVIGIAGSVGKSSARRLLFNLLKKHFKTKEIGNSETGITLGILGMFPKDYSKKDWISMLIRAPFRLNCLRNTKYLIAEMGIDDPFPPKNMEYLLTIIKPDIAVSLNASAAHTMQFEKLLSGKQIEEKTEEERYEYLLEKIAEEDTKIITKSGAQVGIYNADDKWVKQKVERGTKRKRDIELKTFGKNKINDICFGEYSVDLKGTTFEFSLKEDKWTLEFKNYVLPKVYGGTLASVILASLETGLAKTEIIEGLTRNFSLPHGRSSIFNGIKNSFIIDSSYNASKASVIAFLSLLERLKLKTRRETVFVLGDMRELGHEAKKEHEEVARKALEAVDYLYLVGPLTREYVLNLITKKGARKTRLKDVRWFKTSQEAGTYLLANLPEKSIVLVKGSQNGIYLEETVKALLENKGDAVKLCRQDPYWLKIKGIEIAS